MLMACYIFCWLHLVRHQQLSWQPNSWVQDLHIMMISKWKCCLLDLMWAIFRSPCILKYWRPGALIWLHGIRVISIHKWKYLLQNMIHFVSRWWFKYESAQLVLGYQHLSWKLRHPIGSPMTYMYHYHVGIIQIICINYICTKMSRPSTHCVSLMLTWISVYLCLLYVNLQLLYQQPFSYWHPAFYLGAINDRLKNTQHYAK